MIHTVIQLGSEVVDALIDFVPKVVMLASIIAAIVPNSSNFNTLNTIRRWIDIAAINVKNAKNKNDTPT